MLLLLRVCLAVGCLASPGFATGQDAASPDRNALNSRVRPGNMLADSPVSFPKEGALPAKYPPDVREQSEPVEKDYYLFSSPCRSLAQIAEIQAAMPKGEFTQPSADWTNLKRTRRILTQGGELRLLALGDSIVNDTMRSGWVAKLAEVYPKATIHATVYVRGGGGCQHFKEQDRIATNVIPRKPNLVFIGGISQRDTESIREVVHQLRAGLPEVEILLASGTFGTVDPRDPAALSTATHSGTGAYGQALKKLAEEEQCAYLDMTTPWAEYIRSSKLHPHLFYRDVVHANEYGEQILSKILMAFWTAAPPDPKQAFALPLPLANIHIRDPFILPVERDQSYYLVASSGRSVIVRQSEDLQTWGEPKTVFRIPDNFWGSGAIWAPEIHPYRGRYYLFATFMNQQPIGEQWTNWPPRVHRGTQVLVADSPLGPFKPFANGSHTPTNEMALDGTLWVEDGRPYMVYCHEWVQVRDGTMKLVRLSEDLSEAMGEPQLLFKGSEAPWAPRGGDRYITDGPALYRGKSGKLFMLWSSFSGTGYTTGIAISDSGKIVGPWRQQSEPFFREDGGHATIFRRFDGALMVSLHSPNRSPDERCRLLEVEDTGETLRCRSGSQAKAGTSAERSEEKHSWVLAYFRQRYEGRVEIDAEGRTRQVPLPNPMREERLHLALSTDGRHWTPLNGNRPVWNQWLRDPFVGRGPDGLWHLLATGGGRAPKTSQTNLGPACLHATSRDLLEWENVCSLNLMQGVRDDAGRLPRNIWAPEWFLDSLTGEIVLLWSSSFEDAGWKRSRLWFCRTRDWKTFTPARVLFAPPYSVIDGTLVEHGGTYYLFHKEEEFGAKTGERRAIRLATADKLEGPYRIHQGPLNQGQIAPVITEGPAVMPDPTKPGWLLLYDYCMSNGYGVSASADLIHWSIEEPVSVPPDARHGSVARLSAAEAEVLRANFPDEDAVSRKKR